MTVTQDPTLIEIGCFFLTDLIGDFVKSLRPTGCHGKGHGDLFFGQAEFIQWVDPPGIKLIRFTNFVDRFGHVAVKTLPN